MRCIEGAFGNNGCHTEFLHSLAKCNGWLSLGFCNKSRMSYLIIQTNLKCFRWHFRSFILLWVFFFGGCENPQSRKNGNIEIVYRIEHRMACCPVRLVLKMHFPSQKIKKGNQVKCFAISSFFLSFAFSFFTRLFIDIIMGNFRQHEKIYFTSCSSWSNFQWEEGKVYLGKLFFHRYRFFF